MADILHVQVGWSRQGTKDFDSCLYTVWSRLRVSGKTPKRLNNLPLGHGAVWGGGLNKVHKR